MRAYLKIGIVSGGAKLDGDKIVVASTELSMNKEPAKAETKTTVAKAVSRDAGKEKK
jgi:hypothetical protein